MCVDQMQRLVGGIDWSAGAVTGYGQDVLLNNVRLPRLIDLKSCSQCCIVLFYMCYISAGVAGNCMHV